MTSAVLDDLVFVYTSRTHLPNFALHGYCFVGADYVYGDAGAHQLQDDRGFQVEPGLDGCYASVAKMSGHHELGTDHSGHKRLYYYEDGDYWCVSNSLIRVAETVVRDGRTLTVNFNELIGLKETSTFASQSATWKTIFNEIQLVPRYKKLILRDGRLSTATTSRYKARGYREAVIEFATQWVARFTTLTSDHRLHVSSDLTGGIDSRAIFALAQRASRYRSAVKPISWRSSTEERWRKDLEVATRIADYYRVPLNEARAEQTHVLSNDARYSLWRDLCLGTYLSVYFPREVPDAARVHIHGGGGGNHRPFFSNQSGSEFVRSLAPKTPEYLFEAWRGELYRTLAALSDEFPTVHPMTLHYREFRNRLHGGRSPQYRVVLSPLSSRYLDAATELEGVSSASRVNFDVMALTQPRILDFPYDDERKKPSRDVREQLLLRGLPRRVRGGRVYIPEVARPRVSTRTSFSKSTPRPLDRLAEDIETHMHPLVREFLGQRVVGEAMDALDEARETGRFAHANDGKGASRLLAVGTALRYGGVW